MAAVTPGEGVPGACLVTGGAGFIGRWVVQDLLGRGAPRVVVLDDFSNSDPSNLEEFRDASSLRIVRGNITRREDVQALWKSHGPFEVVYHLAASIRVQDSIDNPRSTFTNDVLGTFEILEECRRQLREEGASRAPRLVVMSTCMVYARAEDSRGIGEGHPTRPASPYAASKIAAENLALSYHLTYGLPVKVLRPFNTYGPFQKRNLEGGVVAIFISRDLEGKPLLVKGDGTQTRDLLYVSDCARFVADAGLSPAGDGEILNAGSGTDVSIRRLAELIADPKRGGRGGAIDFVEHDHPQSEILKLLADNSKATKLFRWRPRVPLEEGVALTREWIRKNPDRV
jgi:nucleoside-diphosphate-sugar epimerase